MRPLSARTFKYNRAVVTIVRTPGSSLRGPHRSKDSVEREHANANAPRERNRKRRNIFYTAKVSHNGCGTNALWRVAYCVCMDVCFPSRIFAVFDNRSTADVSAKQKANGSGCELVRRIALPSISRGRLRDNANDARLCR